MCSDASSTGNLLFHHAEKQKKFVKSTAVATVNGNLPRIMTSWLFTSMIKKLKRGNRTSGHGEN